MKSNVKKFLSVSMCIIAVCILFLGVTDSTAGAAGYKTFYDTFNYEPAGTKSSGGGWTISTGTYGTVTVESQSMKLTDTHYAVGDEYRGVSAAKTFSSQTGKINFETRFKFVSTGDPFNSFMIDVLGKDGAGNAAQLVRLNCYPDGKIGLDNNGTVNYMPASDGSVTIQNGSWYILRLMFDINAGTFDLYLYSDAFAGFSGDPSPGVFNSNTKTYYIMGKPFYQSGAVNIDTVKFSTEKYRGSYYIDYLTLTEYPKPPALHPRLYAQGGDIPALRAKVETPNTNAYTVWQKAVSQSDKYTVTDMILPTPAPGGYNYDLTAVDKRKTVEANAIRYLLYGDPVIGDKAVDMAINFMNTAVCGGLSGKEAVYENSDILNMGAEVFDWCFDRLTAQDKATFINNFERIAGLLEVGYPPVNPMGSLVGHGSGPQFLETCLNVGVALFGDKNEMYDVTAGRIFREFIAPRDFWYASGMHHQGADYGQTRFEPEMYPTWIFDRMGFPDVFSKEQGKVPYRWIYQRRPDGQLLRGGDIFSSGSPLGTYWSYFEGYMLTAGYNNDPYIQGEFRKQYANNMGVVNAPLEIILGKLDDIGASKSSLPLTRYFGYPTASMIARTGWEEGINSSTAVAEMNIGGYHFNNHQHLDAGHFQVYYKGALAIDSGIYQGVNGAYSSTHDKNYHKRSIAHNTLLVYDANEAFKYWGVPVSNDGGQRWPEDAETPYLFEDLLSKSYIVSEVAAHQYGPDPVNPDFSYIKGNLEAAYSSKVSKYSRSFVFLNFKDSQHPAALVVYDRITSSSPNFTKYWLLHSIEEPSVSGNITTITRTQNGNNGKLINTTLLPASTSIDKVGGAGHEFEVFGVNYPQMPDRTGTCDEGGAWRVQISPSDAAKDDTFLNVMQVQDNTGGPAPLTPETVDSPFMVGTKVLDRVVMFSKNGDRLNCDISFTTSGPGNLKYVVTDLEPGTWTISNPGYNGTFTVTPEGCMLYFTGLEGTTTLTRSAVPSEVNDTFDKEAIGTKNSGSGWTISQGTYGTVTVEDVPGLGNHSMKLLDTDYDTANEYRIAVQASRTFTPLSGKVTFGTKMMFNRVNHPNNNFDIGIMGDNNSKQIVRFLGYSTGAFGYADNGSGGSAYHYIPAASPSMVFPENEWVDVKIAVDTNTSAYDLTVTCDSFKTYTGIPDAPATLDKATGTYKVTGRPFYLNNTVSAVDTIRVLSNRYTGAYYYDYINIIPQDAEAPSAPDGLASPGKTDKAVYLTWNASYDNIGVAGYDIYKDAVLVGSTTSTTHMATGLSPDTLYTFTVKARDVQGNISSASAGLNVRTLISTPANVLATAVSPTGISVTWDAVSSAAGYDIEKDGTVAYDVTSPYLHSGLTQDTQHTYRVRAKNANGTGDWCWPVTRSTLPEVNDVFDNEPTGTKTSGNGWTITQGTYGTITIEDFPGLGNKSMKLRDTDYDTANEYRTAVSATRTFTPISGKVVFETRMQFKKINHPNNNFEIGIGGNNNSKQVVRFLAYSTGAFGYADNGSGGSAYHYIPAASPIFIFPENEWVTVKIVVDTITSTYDLTVTCDAFKNYAGTADAPAIIDKTTGTYTVTGRPFYLNNTITGVDTVGILLNRYTGEYYFDYINIKPME